MSKYGLSGHLSNTRWTKDAGLHGGRVAARGRMSKMVFCEITATLPTFQGISERPVWSEQFGNLGSRFGSSRVE